MTETIDQLIQARFDRVADSTDDRDWTGVLARAHSAGRRAPRRRVPARLGLAAAIAVLAATVTAAAFGWPGTFVDFFRASPAPQNVRAFFRAHNAAIPGSVSPKTEVGQAREVMTATFDANQIPPGNPTVHTLYVAPRTTGGFCYLWTDYGGGCADPESATAGTTDPAARPLGVEWLANTYAGFVDGWVRGEAKTVDARFADGTTAEIPVTWVSAPIDAGFFAYVVPGAHQTRADAVTSIVALDGNGNAVGTQDIPVTHALDEDVLQTLPDGTKYSLPRRAQAARARKIVAGSRFYLWVMPRTGGGDCYLYRTGNGGGGGCTSPRWLARIPAVDGGIRGSFFFAQVRPEVTKVVLRYANGSSERLTPIDGFVLRELAGRPTAAVGLDRNGRAIYTQRLGAG